MGVVYFSIIPTFEPSRYYKCWIVCFYYTLLVSSDPNGCYAISDSDTQETSSEYRFILRYQMSDEKAWELINSGRFPNANELVGRVTVHKVTGKVTLDSLNDTWWLW